jgi:hypothetical protein
MLRTRCWCRKYWSSGVPMRDGEAYWPDCALIRRGSISSSLGDALRSVGGSSNGRAVVLSVFTTCKISIKLSPLRSISAASLSSSILPRSYSRHAPLPTFILPSNSYDPFSCARRIKNFASDSKFCVRVLKSGARFLCRNSIARHTRSKTRSSPSPGRGWRRLVRFSFQDAQ